MFYVLPHQDFIYVRLLHSGASDSEEEGIFPTKRRALVISDDEADDNTNEKGDYCVNCVAVFSISKINICHFLEEPKKNSDAVLKMFDSDSEDEKGWLGLPVVGIVVGIVATVVVVLLTC